MNIVGMIPVYNEADIIGSVIEHNLSQGLELVIFDTGSTDGSYEICSRYLGNGVLSLERVASAKFEFSLFSETLYKMALKHNPDWAMWSSADEFHESPYPGMLLKQSVEKEAERGYNLIQFNNFEFWPTECDRDSTESDVRKRLRYYTWNDDCQFHCWKVYDGINVGDGGGHYPTFPKNVPVRLAPTKYVLRHYRIRSYAQGMKKVFVDRLPRYSESERRKGWHLHYDKFESDESFFVIDSRNLNRYEEDGRWVVKKTFDWTGGMQGIPWANPPVPLSRSIRVANRLPFAANVWKRMFLRKHRTPTRVRRSGNRDDEDVQTRN